MATALGKVSRLFSNLAQDLGIAIFLVSQLNRSVESRTDKRPQPSDLRESGAIEQDAEAVLLIYRDEYYNPDSRWKGTAEVIVPYNRNGAPGTARLGYKPQCYRFENLHPDWEPEPAREKEQKPRKSFRKGGNAAADAAAGDP